MRVKRDGPVSTVLLSRPERRNAVDGATAAALADAFRAFEADPDAAVAVLHGEGGTFCAGADLKAVGTPEGNVVTADGDGPMGPTRMRLSKPVIAAVAGHAVAGGLELALWCDLRVAEEDAVFGVFCRRWGVPLIDGGTVRLPRLIGTSRAMDMILTGRAVSCGRGARDGAGQPGGRARWQPCGRRGARPRAGSLPADVPARGPVVAARAGWPRSRAAALAGELAARESARWPTSRPGSSGSAPARGDTARSRASLNLGLEFALGKSRVARC